MPLWVFWLCIAIIVVSSSGAVIFHSLWSADKSSADYWQRAWQREADTNRAYLNHGASLVLHHGGSVYLTPEYSAWLECRDALKWVEAAVELTDGLQSPESDDV